MSRRSVALGWLLACFGLGAAESPALPEPGTVVDVLQADGGFIRGTVLAIDAQHWHLQQRRSGPHGSVTITVRLPRVHLLGWQTPAAATPLRPLLRLPIDGGEGRRYLARTALVIDVPLAEVAR